MRRNLVEIVTITCLVLFMLDASLMMMRYPDGSWVVLGYVIFFGTIGCLSLSIIYAIRSLYHCLHDEHPSIDDPEDWP